MAATQEIYEKHDVLYHYTDEAGLKGILESQCLWATHYKSLNDTTEVKHFWDALAQELWPAFEEIVGKWKNKSLRAKRSVRKHGGIEAVARHDADAFIKSFYQVTFEGGKAGFPFCEPLITSFCSHIEDDDYEREHGLLSQWRAYAEGGYAIIFDTKKLCELLFIENDKFMYIPGPFIGDVVYEGNQELFHKEFGKLLKKIPKQFDLFLETGKMNPEELFFDFVSGFTRYKHCGFKEEREVRIVTTPLTRGMEDHIREIEPKFDKEGKKGKQIFPKDKGRAPKGYIKLFKFGDNHPGLPIQRVIVGPHQHQEKLKSMAEEWTKNLGIKVTCSETPYIGRD
jgi:hypothetical protein